MKPSRKPRAPALLPSLLAALDARPDVTVLTRTWPVLFVQLRYALEKTVLNENGFSPLHRETPLFYGQAWRLDRVGKGAESWTAEPIPREATVIGDGAPVHIVWDLPAGEAFEQSLGPIHPEVSARLGLTAPVERVARITGAALER